MRTFLKICNTLLYVLVVVVLVAAIGSAIAKQPILLSVIRSYSMYPLYTRGDMVFVQRLTAAQKVREGDIVLFRAESGSLASQGWIIHRVVGGDDDSGYITQGDNNEQTDQENGGSTPIKRDWMVSRAVTIGSIPLKVPLLGYVPLWAEGMQKNTFLLPIIAVILAAVIAVSELMPKKKKRRRKARNDLEMPLIYVCCGLTLTIIMAATMLAASQHLSLYYEVSNQGQGVLMGSSVGVLQVGEQVERPLVDLENKTILPIIAVASTSDPQISFSHDCLSLRLGQQVKLTMTVNAGAAGEYNSDIWVGMFFPFLPRSLIFALCNISFWLALAVVALIPGLPIMLYPVIDQTMRRQVSRGLRKELRNFQRKLPFA